MNKQNEILIDCKSSTNQNQCTNLQSATSTLPFATIHPHRWLEQPSSAANIDILWIWNISIQWRHWHLQSKYDKSSIEFQPSYRAEWQSTKNSQRSITAQVSIAEFTRWQHAKSWPVCHTSHHSWTTCTTDQRPFTTIGHGHRFHIESLTPDF